jgi:hypothetical protein
MLGVTILEIVAGAILILWPLQWKRSMARVRGRVVERGGDVGRWDQAMGLGWIRAVPVIAPLIGVTVIILGVAG